MVICRGNYSHVSITACLSLRSTKIVEQQHEKRSLELRKSFVRVLSTGHKGSAEMRKMQSIIDI
jgi:hypothetical protein